MEDRVFEEFFAREGWHWWFRGRRRVMWALLREAGLPPLPTILDAGCGPGRNLAEFGRIGCAIGVDTSPQALDICAERGLAVLPARIEALPFEDGSFDLVLACDVIEHIDDDIGALRELSRVTAAGGQLLITVPAYSWMWSRHDERLHHRRRYTRARLRRAARAGGWRLRRATYYNATLLPAIALARAGQRIWPPRDDYSDYNVPPGLNGVFLVPMMLEAGMIARGLDLPFGVSLAMLCDVPAR